MLSVDQIVQQYAQQYPQEHAKLKQFTEFVNQYSDAFERTQTVGHITASAMLLSPESDQCLLMHHRKLDKWLQPGGHADGDKDTFRVAQKEVYEETGICQFMKADAHVLDIDIHEIPARPQEPKHKHYDICYLMQSTCLEFVQNEESLQLKWVDLDEVLNFNNEPRYQRIMTKIKQLLHT
jgi:8-oxo-dGTP pyrophosphatase MutT (NUDIX family)